MKKEHVIRKIIAALTAELEVYMQSARAAHAGATDEQSKAEGKYDTRGLEASYLAHGQAQQAAEILEAMREFEGMRVRDFAKGEAIALGALVVLAGKREETAYFIGPRAGGTEVLVGKQEVLVITPQSPMGTQLAGRCEGEEVEIRVGGASERYRVAEVR